MAKLGKQACVEKDRKRKREAYVPVTDLSASQLKKRRQDTNARVKRHYKQRKETIGNDAPISTRRGHTL